jgi:hypothetical protein
MSNIRKTYTRNDFKFFYKNVEELALDLKDDMLIPSKSSNGFRWHILIEYAIDDC